MNRVTIVQRDHPWYGHSGEAEESDESFVRVKLDNGFHVRVYVKDTETQRSRASVVPA